MYDQIEVDMPDPDELYFTVRIKLSYAELQALSSAALDEQRDTRSQALCLIRAGLIEAGYLPCNQQPQITAPE